MPTNRATSATQGTEFARWFADRRADIGTQDDVAKRLGLSRPTIARWESGTSLPSGKHVSAIAKLLAVSDAEVAMRAGIVLDSLYSERALSLARMIDSRAGSIPEERFEALTRGLDSLLTALA